MNGGFQPSVSFGHAGQALGHVGADVPFGERIVTRKQRHRQIHHPRLGDRCLAGQDGWRPLGRQRIGTGDDHFLARCGLINDHLPGTRSAAGRPDPFAIESLPDDHAVARLQQSGRSSDGLPWPVLAARIVVGGMWMPLGHEERPSWLDRLGRLPRSELAAVRQQHRRGETAQRQRLLRARCHGVPSRVGVIEEIAACPFGRAGNRRDNLSGVQRGQRREQQGGESRAERTGAQRR